MTPEILEAMKKVEENHFRTIHDTGANDHAMLVWNALRAELKLPRLSRDDLSFWNGEKYETPANSNLL